MTYRWLEQVASTNTWLKEHSTEMPDLTMVLAKNQTAGRGQRGNSWESEPGKNLTYSLFKRHGQLQAGRQFAVSEATALAVADALASFGIEAKVKWPNDIYVADRKISGILIEHSVMGRDLEYSILGVGLNVNQEQFLSDAPNPVSMRNLLGRDTNLDDVLAKMSGALEKRLENIYTQDGREKLHSEFLRRLWRGDCAALYRDANSDEIFEAEISDVEPSGILVLRPTDGSEVRRYAFKEVSFIL